MCLIFSKHVKDRVTCIKIVMCKPRKYDILTTIVMNNLFLTNKYVLQTVSDINHINTLIFELKY